MAGSSYAMGAQEDIQDVCVWEGGRERDCQWLRLCHWQSPHQGLLSSAVSDACTSTAMNFYSWEQTFREQPELTNSLHPVSDVYLEEADDCVPRGVLWSVLREYMMLGLFLWDIQWVVHIHRQNNKVCSQWVLDSLLFVILMGGIIKHRHRQSVSCTVASGLLLLLFVDNEVRRGDWDVDNLDFSLHHPNSEKWLMEKWTAFILCSCP